MEKLFTAIYLCFLFSSSCDHWTQKDELHIALQYAGENRIELDKVLQFYSQHPGDSLKYKAACFLIENMPGHYSYKDTVYINRYYAEIDSAASMYKNEENAVKDSIYRLVKSRYTATLSLMEDIHYITADFLIDNIERSFAVWHYEPWAKHIGFNDFCEYILPYKATETQTLDNWRTYFSDHSNQSLSYLQHCDLYKNLVSKACETVNNELRNHLNPRLVNEPHIPVRRMSTLYNIPYGLCSDYSILALSVMRAKGIPVCMDFTPQWPFRSQGHNWNVLLENSGLNAVFEGANSSSGTPHKRDHKMAKVFRRTYAVNKEIREINRTEKYVPPTFREYFMKDVTTEYMVTTDVELEIEVPPGNFNYAYLAVFDNKNWIPVHGAKIWGKKVKFDRMGKDIVYLPVCYGENGIIPVHNPVLVTVKGEVIPLRADLSTPESLELHRKFPVFPHLYDICMRVVGGRIQASHTPGFENPVTLHTITDYGITAKEIRLDSLQTSYRYWRYYPPDLSYGNMAELSFFERGFSTPVRGKIIGTEGSLNEDGLHGKEAVFDGDVLTFFDAPHHSGCWVGMDFGKPVDIDKIVYVPRSDGNIIEIGDEYELVYWGDTGWESVERKIAEHVSLRFEGCPGNALFLLHNRSKGEEERIFTYEDGEQVWW